LANQIKEWQDLIEKTEASTKEDEKKILDISNKISQTNEQIKLKKEAIAKFNLKECEDKIKEIEVKKITKKTKEGDVKNQQEKHNVIIAEFSKLQTLYNQNVEVVNSLKKQISKIGSDGKFECSECKSIVSKEHILSKIDEATLKYKEMSVQMAVKKDEQGKSEKNIDGIENEIKKLEDFISAGQEIIGKIKQWEMDKARFVEIQSNIQELTKLKQDLIANINKNQEQKKSLVIKKSEVEKKHNTDIQNLQKQINSLIDQYKNAENNAKLIKEEAIKLTEDKNKLVQEKSTCDSSVGSLNKEIEIIKEINAKLVSIKKQQDLLEKELKRLIMLEDIYGLEGIQTRIVARYLPLLNVYVKEFIDILTNGSMGVEIVINEKMKIDILLRGGTADIFAMLSGGEKVLVKLAVSIGLGLLSFTRCSNKPEIIMLDEVLGSLDNEHTGAVFKMLHALKKKFSRVLVISHKPQINEIIERKIIIEKDSGDFDMSEIRRAS